MLRPKMSLARQLLILQMLIIAAVIIVFLGASYVLSEGNFRNTEGRSMRSVAESLASSSLVRYGVEDRDAHTLLAPVAENARAVSDASVIEVTNRAGMIKSATDPTLIGTQLDLDGSDVLEGRAWVGVTEDAGEKIVVAHVPIISDEQEMIGVVAVGKTYPTWAQSLIRSAPNVVVYVGTAITIGVIASILLARRLKRQTMNLEPREISELVQHREAMLHRIREGVIGLGPDNEVTLVNDEAVKLLGLTDHAVGDTVDDLGIDGELKLALLGQIEGEDFVVMWNGRILVLNRNALEGPEVEGGSVTTLRDRTELLSLQHELDVTRSSTSALRAQAHEFRNHLHVISGLIQLDRNDEVVKFINRVSSAQARRADYIMARMTAPSVAAILIAKMSLAEEKRIEFQLTEDSNLPSLADEVEADLVTVTGNLIDNALEVLPKDGTGRVEMKIDADDARIELRVSDNGPGIRDDARARVFAEGYTTKIDSEGHGIGLTLVRMVCNRRGGAIELVSAGGEDGENTVFRVTLPCEQSTEEGNRCD